MAVGENVRPGKARLLLDLTTMGASAAAVLTDGSWRSFRIYAYETIYAYCYPPSSGGMLLRVTRCAV